MTCPICIESMDMTADDIAYLPCLHVLHNTCLMEYMKSKIEQEADISCPLCRVVHYTNGTQDYAFMKQHVAGQSRHDEPCDVYVNPQYSLQPTLSQRVQPPSPRPRAHAHALAHMAINIGVHDNTSNSHEVPEPTEQPKSTQALQALQALHAYKLYLITLIVIVIFTSAGIAIGMML